MKPTDPAVTPVTNTQSTTPILVKLGANVSVPPSGRKLGRFTKPDVKHELSPSGDETRYLHLPIQLDEPDTKGNPIVVSKKYKLMDNGNHFLRRDLRIWAGKDIMPDGGDFNIATIIGQPVVVEIENHWIGRKATTVVKALLPVPQPVEQEAQQASA